MTIYRGDDTGGRLGKRLVLDIHSPFDLQGCFLVFNYQGVTRRFEDVKDGDQLEIFFSHTETAAMSIGTYLARLVAIDASGKVRTVTDKIRIKVSNNLAECYGDETIEVIVGTAVSWSTIVDLPFDGVEVDLSSDDKKLAALGTIIEKLGGTVKAAFAILLMMVSTTAMAYNPPSHTDSFTRSGVTYAQRGGMNEATYVVTNVEVNGQPRPLAPYLYQLDLDDTYPDDADWYYRHRTPTGGRCSVRRVGNRVERNYDWPFDAAATFVLKVSGTDSRFASVGVANVGTNLTDEFVRSGVHSRYYKCLAGHTVDGVNENGVCVEVNVTSGTWPRTSGTVHGLGAVRWVLDHGTNAQQAAEYIAAHVYLPSGFGENLHWLVADRDSTYIVENGAAHAVTNAPVVMTNFNLDRHGGEGYERYASLMDGATIQSQWWTKAYNPATRPVRTSDLGGEYQQIWAAWNNGKTKEQHRGETFGGKMWWQTVHCSIYDLQNLTLRIAVQEIEDWYVFACPSVGKVKSVNGKTGHVTLDATEVGALPDNQAKLVANANFSNAVVRVSPPVELPAKWALANVTNAQGQAVTAADVKALPFEAKNPIISQSKVDTENWFVQFGNDGVTGFTFASDSGLTFTMHDGTGWKNYGIGIFGIMGNGFTYPWNKIASKDDVYTKSDADTLFLTKTDAASTYLSKNDASTTYLAKGDAASTYLSKADADTSYLKKADASATYATKAEVGNVRGIADYEYTTYNFANRSGIQGHYSTRVDAGDNFIWIVLDGEECGMSTDYASHDEAVLAMKQGKPITLARAGGAWSGEVAAGTVFTCVMSEGHIVSSDELRDGYVPRTFTINGTPMMGNGLTVQGMPITGLVWNATAGNVRTADGAKTIGAEDVGALKKLTATSQYGESISLMVEKNYYPNEPHTEYDDILYNCPSLVSDYISGDSRTITTLDYGGLYQREYKFGSFGWGQTAMYGIAFGTSAGGLYLNGYGTDAVQFSLQIRDGSYGYLATENWASLRTMLVDANSDMDADCECISTNICKLAAPAITNAVIYTRDRFYDAELDVTWKRTVSGGRIFYDIEAVGDSTED